VVFCFLPLFRIIIITPELAAAAASPQPAIAFGGRCNAESSHETDDGQTVSRRVLGACTRAWVHPWNAYLS
jgi:hypothetical protein